MMTERFRETRPGRAGRIGRTCIAGVVAALLLLLSCPAASGRDADASDGEAARFQRVAKAGVEFVLSKALGTPVEIGKVALDKEAGALELENLHIRNPEGFESEDAIHVKRARVEANLETLMSREPEIRLISVSGANINVETNLRKGTNLHKLLASAHSLKKRPLMKLLPEKEWRIGKLAFEKSEVNVITDLLARQTKTETIDRFELGGAGTRPMTTLDAVISLLTRFLKQIYETAGIAGGGVMGNLKYR